MCSTNKKPFATAQEAIEFEAKNRAMYGGVKQHEYLCEECGSFHLSALPPGYENVTNYSRFENTAPERRKWTRYRLLTDEEKKEVRAIYARGNISARELAEKFGTGAGHIYRTLHESEQHTTAVTIDSLCSEERELELRLERIRKEKDQRIEAARVKVSRLDDGQVRIQKEGNAVVLPADDCLTVMSILEDMLSEVTAK